MQGRQMLRGHSSYPPEAGAGLLQDLLAVQPPGQVEAAGRRLSRWCGT
jgi:hypothetical protein